MYEHVWKYRIVQFCFMYIKHFNRSFITLFISKQCKTTQTNIQTLLEKQMHVLDVKKKIKKRIEKRPISTKSSHKCKHVQNVFMQRRNKIYALLSARIFRCYVPTRPCRSGTSNAFETLLWKYSLRYEINQVWIGQIEVRCTQLC